jgi:Phosphoesterase family
MSVLGYREGEQYRLCFQRARSRDCGRRLHHSYRPKVVARIDVAGNPLKTILDKTQSYLYVTEDNSDVVDIITTKDNVLFQSVIASAPDKLEFDNVLTYRGSAPNSAALSPDTLYVTLGGTNAISVITGVPFHPEVIGLIPAGFQPNAITLSDDGFATQPERQKFNPANPSDPDILPGTADVGAVDGPGDADVQQGYIWDAVTRAGKTFRNYGFHCDQAEYLTTPLERDPFSKKLRVGFPSRLALVNTTDPYFRSFDTAFSDFWREKEWEREFADYVKNGDLPALSMVRLMEDHMGSFGKAIDGVNTPEIQQADNDYAVAKLIEKVANSPYKSDTLIFILEDDSQNGADHVDSHRSTGYVVGPYVKHGAVISEKYTTVNMLRTIEDVLNVDHVDILTASEKPMTNVFDLSQTDWTFDAVPSIYLYNTQLPLPGRFAKNKTIPKPTHDAAYWAERTKTFDFTREDNVNPDKFNRVIWAGLHGDKPYPTVRSGLDLRRNRSLLLKKAALANN